MGCRQCWSCARLAPLPAHLRIAGAAHRLTDCLADSGRAPRSADGGIEGPAKAIQLGAHFPGGLAALQPKVPRFCRRPPRHLRVFGVARPACRAGRGAGGSLGIGGAGGAGCGCGGGGPVPAGCGGVTGAGEPLVRLDRAELPAGQAELVELAGIEATTN